MKRLAVLALLIFATFCCIARGDPLGPTTPPDKPAAKEVQPTKVEVAKTSEPLPVNVTTPPVTNWAQVLTAVVIGFIGFVKACEKAYAYWQAWKADKPSSTLADREALAVQITENVLKALKGQP